MEKGSLGKVADAFRQLLVITETTGLGLGLGLFHQNPLNCHISPLKSRHIGNGKMEDLAKFGQICHTSPSWQI